MAHTKLKELERSLNYQNQPGKHTRLSPVVGSRSHELDMVSEATLANLALQYYEQQLYKPDRIYLIPKEQHAAADVIAKQLFDEYLKKYQADGITRDNAVASSTDGMPGAASNKTFIYDIENEWNTWCVHAIAEAKHGTHNEKNGSYLPPDIVKYHELMHVEEIQKGITTSEYNKKLGREIMTTTKTVILLDFIYKKINGIPLDQIVDYKQALDFGDKKIPLGEVANFYRKLETQYGSIAKAITSPESLAFLPLTPSAIDRCANEVTLSPGRHESLADHRPSKHGTWSQTKKFHK